MQADKKANQKDAGDEEDSDEQEAEPVKEETPLSKTA